MLRFLVRRLAASLVVVWIVATASFFLLHAAPGGPFESDARRSAAVQAAIEERYGLHDSLIVQYGRELSHLAHGDLGRSLARDTSVNDLIAEHFPVSALVGVLGLLTAVVLGVALGVAAARRRDTWIDYVAMAIAAIAISVPAFVLGPLLVATVALRLDWLPPGRIDGASSYVLPALSLGLVYLGTIARLTRGSMRDALAQDFVRTARAKGVGERAVVWRHALRVGIAPVVTYLGPATAALISGSFVVEKIFQVPGLGAYFLDAIVDRDYPMLTGVLVFYAVLLVLLNLAVDIAYGLLDPRIR